MVVATTSSADRTFLEPARRMLPIPGPRNSISSNDWRTRAEGETSGPAVEQGRSFIRGSKARHRFGGGVWRVPLMQVVCQCFAGHHFCYASAAPRYRPFRWC